MRFWLALGNNACVLSNRKGNPYQNNFSALHAETRFCLVFPIRDLSDNNAWSWGGRVWCSVKFFRVKNKKYGCTMMMFFLCVYAMILLSFLYH